MKRQKGLNRFRFVTISMVVIGVGFVLFSFLYTRHDKQRFTRWLGKSKKIMEQERTSSSFSDVNREETIDKSHKSAEDEDIDKFIASLEAMEDESTLEPTTDSVNFFNGSSNGSSSRSEEVGDIEDIDFPQRIIDPEKVEAVTTAIHENTQDYLDILLTKIDLYEGRAYLYPESASEDYPEQLQRRTIQVRLKAHELWFEYLFLTEDYDAFNPGGWINEVYSGMAALSGNPSTKRITIFFSDEMLAQYE